MGEVDFLQFCKCISASVLWPISEKLHSITLLCDTANWESIGFCLQIFLDTKNTKNLTFAE